MIDIILSEQTDAQQLAANEITQLSVQLLAQMEAEMPRNQALGAIISAISESLGNMISLVKDDYQQEVVESAHQVIQIGLLSQNEAISELTYGQIGHA